MKTPVQHVSAMLLLGRKIITSSPVLDREIGTVNVKGDRTIAMDKKVEDALISYVKDNDIPADIFSEEIGTVKWHPNPVFTIVFDPLDGSTNYKLGKNLLPYGMLLAVYAGPKLKDIVAAGAIEYTSGLSWIYDGRRTKTGEGEEVKLDKQWTVSKSTPVYLDLYYKTAYDAFAVLPEQVHVRWDGSNIGALRNTLTQVAAVNGASRMRPEEIGAVVALVKGAGGIAVDHDGADLGEYEFATDTTYPLLAGHPDVVSFILRKLLKQQ